MNKISYWWDTVIANLIQGRGSDSAYNKRDSHMRFLWQTFLASVLRRQSSLLF